MSHFSIIRSDQKRPQQDKIFSDNARNQRIIRYKYDTDTVYKVRVGTKINRCEERSMKNHCSIYLRGRGHSLEVYNLNASEAEQLHKACDPGSVTSEIGSLIKDLGLGPQITVVPYTYGIDPADLEISWIGFDTAEPPRLLDKNKYRAGVDESKIQQNVLEYIQIGTGKIFGEMVVPIENPDEFDAELLQFDYIEFSYDGWPERFGRVITKAWYGDQELELDLEDNGLDADTFLLGCEFDSGEFVDDVVIYEARAGKVVSGFDWGGLDRIFS